ncbi:MAG: thermonuclease family protein [Chroococcidiopsidaceae cyanobacterium CP_BM_ER_R8_30]|nr:thermonuclease family protein [Chroococcidiopsidaceae cyanobacterium CP_BM_ER_R8_30]
MSRKRLLITLILIWGLLGCATRPAINQSPTPSVSAKTAPVQAKYYVKRIADGDTITVVNARGVESKIRFACVDAPEVPHTKEERASYKPVDLDQFKWGRQARNRLTQLLQQGGNRVSLNLLDSDRYGRKVAEVWLPDKRLVQEILAREGLAVVYTQFIKNCPDASPVKQAEAEAKQQKVGIWGDRRFVTPSEWRRQNKQKA